MRFSVAADHNIKSLKMMKKNREKTFTVIFEKDEGEVRCVCLMFEYKGILCRHAIAVLSRNRIKLLPEKYIM